jgi:quercetin dioxygenase-like cupin family protein
VLHAGEIHLAPFDPERSSGFARCALVGHETGSVHLGLGLCALEPGGHTDLHLHSYEESFYVLAGAPTLVLDGRRHRLGPGGCGVVQVGVAHAWIEAGGEEARWLDLLAPQPRSDGRPKDTFYLGPPPEDDEAELDVRDPRSRHLFRFEEEQMAPASLRESVPIDAPSVSGSMDTAVLAYSGIAVKMLVDRRLHAQFSTLFMVEYQPGGVAQPHDHPLEEAYFLLEGEVEAEADGDRYVLGPGDVFWTGVGCIHAFYNTSGGIVRWIEAQAPQPLPGHAYRFNRDWDYLEGKLGATEAASAAPSR